MAEGASSGGKPGGRLSWEDFEKLLADALSKMALESFLILALPPDEAGQRSYVQFAHWVRGPAGSEWLHAEASGTSFLPTIRRLSRAQEERLEGLEWRRPQPGSSSPNFVREWEMPAPFADVARTVVRTLREVYEVGSPDDLRYKYALFEGGAGAGAEAAAAPGAETLGLGLRPDEPRL